MTHRQRILNVLTGCGERNDQPPYFPDLSYWFDVRRQAGSLPERFADLAGSADSAYQRSERRAEQAACSAETAAENPTAPRFASLLELHRRLNVGLPIHLYNEAYETAYDEGIALTADEGERVRVEAIRTPAGTLTGRRERPHRLESWFWREHLVKTPDDLKVLEYLYTHRTLVPTYPKVQAVLDELGGFGFVDLVLPRSPMPKLLIDWAGIEAGILMLHDHRARCEAFFERIAAADDEAFRLIGAAPGRVAIFGDNVDEVIVSPPMFRRYSLPYYQRRCEQLHAAGKLVACHMDGRLGGLLPMVRDSGLDILDGLTPAPMNDWELDECLAALAPEQRLWCGVPCTLFCDSTPAEAIVSFGRRILETFGPRVVLNVGDQVPPNADIEKVAALAAACRGGRQ